MIRDALTYPLRGENALVMAVGAACFCLPAVAGWVLDLGLLALILQILAIAYFAVFFHSVMEASTKGEERAPAWPDETSGTALLGRVFHVLIPVLVSFLPLIALRAYWRNFGAFGEILWRGMAQLPGIGSMGAFGRDVPTLPPGAVWLSYGLAALGFVYLPMALLVFSFYGESAVVNVAAVARSIARVARDYFAVAAMLIALFAVAAALNRAASILPGALGAPLVAAILFYVMAAGMRAVGLLYARNRGRLGWEN